MSNGYCQKCGKKLPDTSANNCDCDSITMSNSLLDFVTPPKLTNLIIEGENGVEISISLETGNVELKNCTLNEASELFWKRIKETFGQF